MFRSIINYFTYGSEYGRFPRIEARHIWWAYLAAAVLTFGYDAANYPAPPGGYGPESSTPIRAFTAGLFWPLFWSWEFMS